VRRARARSARWQRFPRSCLVGYRAPDAAEPEGATGEDRWRLSPRKRVALRGLHGAPSRRSNRVALSAPRERYRELVRGAPCAFDEGAVSQRTMPEASAPAATVKTTVDAVAFVFAVSPNRAPSASQSVSVRQWLAASAFLFIAMTP